MELKEKIEKELTSLIELQDPLLASLVVRTDGLFLGFVSNDSSINKETAISLATIFNTFTQTSEELKIGDLDYLIIKSKDKTIFFTEIKQNILLISFLDSSSNVNEIYNNIKETGQKISVFLR